MINDSWSCCFPDAHASFGPPDFSDHVSITFTLAIQDQRIKKPFKFYKFLLRNKDLLDQVDLHWYSCNTTGSSMFRVVSYDKLKWLKKLLGVSVGITFLIWENVFRRPTRRYFARSYPLLLLLLWLIRKMKRRENGKSWPFSSKGRE